MKLGLNLRLELIDDFLRERPPLACLEIIAENFFSPGPHHRKLEKLREGYDFSLHCLGMNIGGSDPLDLDYLQQIKQLRKKFQPLHISDHLSVEHHEGIYFHDLLPFPFTSETLQNVKSRVTQIQEYLQTNILLENLSRYIEFRESSISEADFIGAVVRDTGAGILLDINNIWVNQQNLACSAERFLATIDWSQVGEIHLAGPERIENVVVDLHNSEVPEPVLELLLRYRSQIPAAMPIIYERDKDLPNYPDLISYVRELERKCCSKTH